MLGAATLRPSLPMRLASAVPDAVAAGFFLLLWGAPGLLAPKALGTGLLIMLVEFVLMHAAGMIGAVVLERDLSRMKRLAILCGFAATYLVLIASFCYAFQAWWPVAAFAVLLLGKASLVFDRDLPPSARRHRIRSSRVLSACAYLGGVFLTLGLPLPRLGLTPSVVAEAGLVGEGLWVEKPHTVAAFGLIYFAFLAWAKVRDLRLP